MRNETGTPFAFKELDDDGYWAIYFDPSPKLDGYYYYEQVTGPCDEANAELIVELLNKNEASEKTLKDPEGPDFLRVQLEKGGETLAIGMREITLETPLPQDWRGQTIIKRNQRYYRFSYSASVIVELLKEFE